jgi:ABC-type Na+ efflux pump permease subunit
MEEYRNYIQHKSLERLTGTVLLIFVMAGIFVIGLTLETPKLYGQNNETVVVQNN